MNINSTNSIMPNQQAVNVNNSTSQNELGKDAFLKILVTQLKHQNPLEPLKDTEFIAQMAQFSSLEQLTNLNTSISTLLGLQESHLVTEYANLIGSSVTWEYEIDGQMESGEGVIKALSFKNGEVLVEIEGDIQVPIYAIQRIEK